MAYTSFGTSQLSDVEKNSNKTELFTRASSGGTPFCNARVMSEAMLLACVFWYLKAYKISRRSLFRGETLLLVMKAWTLFIEPQKHDDDLNEK